MFKQCFLIKMCFDDIYGEICVFQFQYFHSVNFYGVWFVSYSEEFLSYLRGLLWMLLSLLAVKPEHFVNCPRYVTIFS